MNYLFVIHDSPYHSERPFSALRLIRALQIEQDARIKLFLISDGVYAALPNHLRPEGSANLERLLQEAIDAGAEVKACITCLDHRGLFGMKLIERIEQGNMSLLAAWTAETDRVLSF